MPIPTSPRGGSRPGAGPRLAAIRPCSSAASCAMAVRLREVTARLGAARRNGARSGLARRCDMDHERPEAGQSTAAAPRTANPVRSRTFSGLRSNRRKRGCAPRIDDAGPCPFRRRRVGRFAPRAAARSVRSLRRRRFTSALPRPEMPPAVMKSRARAAPRSTSASSPTCAPAASANCSTDKPVLLRLIATLTRQWIDTSREFMLRLDADLPALRDLIGIAAREPGRRHRRRIVRPAQFRPFGSHRPLRRRRARRL